MNPKNSWLVFYTLLLFLIILISLLSRLLYLLQVMEYANFKYPYAGMDAALYHKLGSAFAQGDWTLGKNGVLCSTPLFAYIIGFTYHFFGENPLWIRVFNLLCSVFTLLGISGYTRILFKSRTTALVATFLAAIYGPFLVFDASGLKTSLGICLISIGLYLVCSALEQPTRIKWLFAGVIWGLAANVYGQLLVCLAVLCPVLIFWKTIWWKKPGSCTQTGGERLAYTAVFILGIGLAIIPFITRNRILNQEIMMGNGTGGIHFYIANHAGAQGSYSRIPGIRPNPAGHVFDAARSARLQTGKSMTPKQVSAFYTKKAVQFISAHPVDFLKLWIHRAGLLICAYEVPNNENYQFLVRISPFLALFLDYGLVFALAAAGWAFAVRTP